MLTKRIVSWLLAAVLCLSLAACGQAEVPAVSVAPLSTEPTTTDARQQVPSGTVTPLPTGTDATVTQPAQQESTVTPLLYKVTDKAGHTAWLFGSIHVGQDYFYPLPDYVLTAFDGADALAVEADIIAFEGDIAQQMEAMKCLLYTDGTSIKDHLTPELYDRAVAALTELGYYMALLDMYCPALWSSLVDSLMMETMEDVDINLGIDRHLLARAKDAQKPIVEIESAKEQYEMLAGFDPALQAMLLEASLDSYDNPMSYRVQMIMLLEMWANGNEEALITYMNTEEVPEGELTEQEAALYEAYNKAMITDRNNAMADYAEEALLSDKEVFICVGAAHVVGEGAMADLLAQRGYTVELVK